MASLGAFAVVVPYYDNLPALRRLLAGLAAQRNACLPAANGRELTPTAVDGRETSPTAADGREFKPVPVVVADDGSPQPLDLSELEHSDAYSITVVRQADEGFRAAAARNLGVAALPAEVESVLFLDADMVPEPDYLATMLTGLASYDVVVGHRKHAKLTGWAPEQVTAWLTGHGPAPSELPEPTWLRDGYLASANLERSDSRSYRYLISAVLGVRRSVFDRLGGFDTRFVGYGGEDWEFAHRCWLAGVQWRHLPDAVAWHDGPDLAGRGSPAEQELILAEQHQRLTRVLPDPWARDPTARTEVPSVGIVVDAAGLDADTVRLMLTALAPGGEVHVWLTGAEPGVAERATGWAGVHLGRPSERELRRIPVLIDGAAASRRMLSAAQAQRSIASTTSVAPAELGHPTRPRPPLHAHPPARPTIRSSR